MHVNSCFRDLVMHLENNNNILVRLILTARVKGEGVVVGGGDDGAPRVGGEPLLDDAVLKVLEVDVGQALLLHLLVNLVEAQVRGLRGALKRIGRINV